MQKATITATLTKVREIRVDGITRFLLQTNNEVQPELIVESRVFYNATRDSGVHASADLLDYVKELSDGGAIPSAITAAFSKAGGRIVGEVNSLYSGGEISIDVVRYDEGDLIPITKKNYEYYEANNFMNKAGEPIDIQEEDGKYFIVASKDWNSVTVTDFMLQKSMKVLAVESMARSQSLSDLLRKPISNDLSIFAKKVKEPKEPKDGGIPKNEQPKDGGDPFEGGNIIKPKRKQTT